jgi:S-(hydroxymethyl)glutathione dehydrogenase / alcohol dehydrogenase
MVPDDEGAVMTSAAVLTKIGSPLEIWDDVVVEAPHAGEVKVRMVASGVCHSDLSVQRGIQTALPPMVLGHEGAGIIEEAGDGVTEVRVGDHVVLSWTPQCRHCFWCVRGQPEFCESGDLAPYGGLLDGTHRSRARDQVLNQMSHLGTFAELTVVSADAVVKVPEEVDFKILALIGCAALTGVGAAMNTARVAKGDSVCVIGCGGVGLNIIQGARLAGAGQIIAVDLRPYKLELASSFGATDMVDASCQDVVGQVRRLTEESTSGSRRSASARQPTRPSG